MTSPFVNVDLSLPQRKINGGSWSPALEFSVRQRQIILFILKTLRDRCEVNQGNFTSFMATNINFECVK